MNSTVFIWPCGHVQFIQFKQWKPNSGLSNVAIVSPFKHYCCQLKPRNLVTDACCLTITSETNKAHQPIMASITPIKSSLCNLCHVIMAQLLSNICHIAALGLYPATCKPGRALQSWQTIISWWILAWQRLYCSDISPAAHSLRLHHK